MDKEKGKKPQKSLVDVVLDKIIENIDFFIPPTNDDVGSDQRLCKYFGIHGELKSKFSDYSPDLTELILKRYFSQKCSNEMGNFEEFLKNLHVFAHLLNCMTTTLDLENILSYCTIDFCKQIIFKISCN
ncbi:Hypothetical predicted protein [Cloeon dipterum]|uniref:Uncharacterized protein n=1 Tax=Cloeon dipterum TaxID=197152 RepID=A0A8S1E4Q7_9INSE|nr:Hypothetical predicted protein [Cloeon dipterum]